MAQTPLRVDQISENEINHNNILYAFGDNFIANSDFYFWQRGFPFVTGGTFLGATFNNNDDKYTADLFNLLSDGNNIVSVTQGGYLTGSYASNSCKMVVVTQNKKFGLAHFIINAETLKLRGKVVSFQFAANTTAAKVINKLRVGILKWTGTGDTITSDLVDGANWNASGADPTLAASWAFLNTPADISISTTLTTYKTENITIPADATNLAIFIWVDDTDAAVNDELYLTALKLEIGSTCSGYSCPDVRLDMLRCQTQYCSSITINANAFVGFINMEAFGINNNKGSYTIYFPINMLKIPILSLWDAQAIPVAGNWTWIQHGVLMVHLASITDYASTYSAGLASMAVNGIFPTHSSGYYVADAGL